MYFFCCIFRNQTNLINCSNSRMRYERARQSNLTHWHKGGQHRLPPNTSRSLQTLVVPIGSEAVRATEYSLRYAFDEKPMYSITNARMMPLKGQQAIARNIERNPNYYRGNHVFNHKCDEWAGASRETQIYQGNNPRIAEKRDTISNTLAEETLGSRRLDGKSESGLF